MKKMMLILISCLGLLLFARPSFASEFNFAVEAELPENQLNQEVGYFDLLVAKGQEQTLKVNLRNDTDQAIIVDVDLANATTNVNGVVEYDGTKQKPVDPSLKHKINSMIKVPDDISVPAHGENILELPLKAPEEVFDGVIAAGITLKEHKNNPGQSDNKNGLAIKNEFAYVLGLVLHQNKQPIKPDLQLAEVKPAQLNYRNVITAKIRNTKAAFLNQVAIDEEISAKASGEKVYETHKNGMQIAPNSQFDFPLPLDGKRLEPGIYLSRIKVFGTPDDQGRYQKQINGKLTKFANYWEFEKEFTIKKEQAEQLNATDVSVEAQGINWLLILVIILATLFVITLLILIIVFKRRKDDEQAHH